MPGSGCKWLGSLSTDFDGDSSLEEMASRQMPVIIGHVNSRHVPHALRACRRVPAFTEARPVATNCRLRLDLGGQVKVGIIGKNVLWTSSLKRQFIASMAPATVILPCADDEGDLPDLPPAL